MPARGNETLPDRSKPETTGRKPSQDEKREDVRRLDSYLNGFDRIMRGLENLNHTEHRAALMQQVKQLEGRIAQISKQLKEEIRKEVYAETGDKAGKKSGTFYGGRSNQKGGPQV